MLWNQQSHVHCDALINIDILINLMAIFNLANVCAVSSLRRLTYRPVVKFDGKPNNDLGLTLRRR